LKGIPGESQDVRHKEEPAMSDEPKKDEQVPQVKTEVSGETLPESELEKVAGGRPIMKVLDVSSAKLYELCISGQPTTPPAK
jgi:type VI protein secretion system component Hcp